MEDATAQLRFGFYPKKYFLIEVLLWIAPDFVLLPLFLSSCRSRRRLRFFLEAEAPLSPHRVSVPFV
jgi:hypothetical protein